MPKLHGSDAIVRILREHGFSFVSQRGSHQKYRDTKGNTVIVPAGRKAIPPGTTGSIIKQSGLPKELFR